jgi:hypothetical protein
MNRIKKADDNIEEKISFSKSKTTRALQKAFKNTKWMQKKVRDNAHAKLNGVAMSMPSKSAMEKLISK